MANIILAIVLVLIVGLAALYVYRVKKSGKKCVGCPSNGCCNPDSTDGCSSCSGCSRHHH